MCFGSPDFLWAYSLIPFFILLYILFSAMRSNFYRKFGETEVVYRLFPKEYFNFRPLKATIFIFAFSLLIFALARPRFGVKTEMVERKGIDIFIALDISKSMLAQDIAPNRITRAKYEISKLLDMFSGDRIGLIVFAGTSFTQMPLTLDYGAAKMFLESVNTDWISSQGTDLSGAIELARKSFVKSGVSKVLLIISDGEENQGDAVKSAKLAAQDGIIVHCVGVGSESGSPIPEQKNGNSVVYKKEKNGNIVLTRLNSKTLEEIAIAANGKYFFAGIDLNLQEIYKEISDMKKNDFGTAKQARFNEQYQLFLFIALILFLLEYFLPDAIVKKNEWTGRFS
ncbi:MAG: VWA domain-containing protein [Chitinispirillales bacterium]|jgi:Ca-activated chloride channel family protein|nr:VWA domain-containing protein [Chitinispirillales bacterium]